MNQPPAQQPFENLQNLLDPQARSRKNALDIRYYVELVLRYRWFIIIAPCITIIAGIYLALTLAKVYQAETLIFVEPQRVPDKYVQSLVSGDLDSRIHNIVQMIKSRTNLINILEEFKLFSKPEFENMFLEDKIEAMRGRTHVEIVSAKRGRTPSNMFTISFKGKDPEKVMNVVNAMAALVINQNLKIRESRAMGTTQFLDDELAKMRERLEEVETALKDYRKDHMGELPEQLVGNIAILDRLQQQLVEKQQGLRDEKNRLISIENQLQIARRQANGGEAIFDSNGGEPTTLEELKQQLRNFQVRYTDQHPDVIRLQIQIKELKSENIQSAGAQGDQRRAALPGRTGRSGSSSAMETDLILQRDGLVREITIIKNEISELQTQVGFYHQRVENTPKREQELLSLRRDYENIKETYNSLLERKLEADIAVNMEKTQQGEQFRILDPARLPDKPISPDMQRLFLMCVAAGLAFGGGLIFLAEFFDDAVRKPESVPARLGIPVLIAMPSLDQRKDVILRRMNNVSSILGVMVLLALLACFAAITILDVPQPVELIRKFIAI
jgi:polysaccharide chain length determinant protein (PEP-CTERM system associated)